MRAAITDWASYCVLGVAIDMDKLSDIVMRSVGYCYAQCVPVTLYKGWQELVGLNDLERSNFDVGLRRLAVDNYFKA